MNKSNKLVEQDRKYPSLYSRRNRKRQYSMTWIGLDYGDGNYRLYRCIPYYFPANSKCRYIKGRLMKSFSQYKLLKIAWKIGVANPDGFDISDSYFININSKVAFDFFVMGWNGIKKKMLIQYIWNKLEETDKILSIDPTT